MSQKFRNTKYEKNDAQAQITPTDRLDFLGAVAMDHDISARNSLSARVATVALSHRHNQSGKIVIKHKTIAREIGCSVSAVRDAVVVLRKRWVNVSPVYIDGECVANRYDPCWDEAAAVGGLWSVKTKRMLTDDEAAEAQKENPVIFDDTPVNQDDTPCPSEDGPLARGGQASGLREPDPCSSEGMQNSVFVSQGVKPGASNPGKFHTRAAERVERRSNSRKGRPSGSPADDDLNGIVEKLEGGLPKYDPFEDHKQVDPRRSRRGAIFALKNLLMMGWAVSEIESYLDAYRHEFDRTVKAAGGGYHACGKTLASHLWHLVTQCGPDRNDDIGELVPGWKIPARLLPDQEPHGQPAPDEAASAAYDDHEQDQIDAEASRESANDNVKFDRASGDGSSYAGECDPDDPF